MKLYYLSEQLKIAKGAVNRFINEELTPLERHLKLNPKEAAISWIETVIRLKNEIIKRKLGVD